ncbi:unnamed protein product [Vitrella brassicaformis CCMP3155]|uniref:Uncharacterized protein n=1 Tax=Vitrella brassicaformis (strain CCMP3155) TaxID=1169540 RepID=A0A0G4F905_VITBC|nr:unnamed protein product [Vitrella brassicaformis CCMP3155]|eukprot:CEM09061.1 unnamed protein product [Vitrella brassicaformis CCMP3155]
MCTNAAMAPAAAATNAMALRGPVNLSTEAIDTDAADDATGGERRELQRSCPQYLCGWLGPVVPCCRNRVYTGRPPQPPPQPRPPPPPRPRPQPPPYVPPYGAAAPVNSGSGAGD